MREQREPRGAVGVNEQAVREDAQRSVVENERDEILNVGVEERFTAREVELAHPAGDGLADCLMYLLGLHHGVAPVVGAAGDEAVLAGEVADGSCDLEPKRLQEREGQFGWRGRCVVQDGTQSLANRREWRRLEAGGILRKRELGVGWWRWAAWGILLLPGCAPEPHPSVGEHKEAGPNAVLSDSEPDAAEALEAALRSPRPMVPLAGESCDAMRAATLEADDDAGAAFVTAEQAACGGAVGEAVTLWRKAAKLEPRLGDISNRRIAQATGGAERGLAPAQTLAGALTGRDDEAVQQLAADMTSAALFALEPAPWVRAKVDAVRWQRVVAQPAEQAGLAWALGWLIETDGGDDVVWMERLLWLRGQPGLTEADRQMLTGRCVDRMRGDEKPRRTAAQTRAILTKLEGCFGALTVPNDAADAAPTWLLDETSEGLDAPSGREATWRHLVAARRADADVEALAMAEALAADPGAWRGAEALRACVSLGASLGESERAAQCEASFRAIRPALAWDETGAFEVAVEQALRRRPVSEAMVVLAGAMQGASEPRRRLVRARSVGDAAELRSLIGETPLSYESVMADRLLRQDGGAGELGSKLAALRYASVSLKVPASGWAATWLAEKGFVGMARSEALLQAEVEGSLHPEQWALAADLLARSGDFATAHSAARRLATLAGGRSGLAFAIPGRVWRESYPLLWEKEVAEASRKQGVPPSLLFAFLRRESGFDAEARSSVGASGLMQVLPATAREVASRHGISLARGLSDPEVNLEVSAAMISELLEEFDGRVEVVAAAYAAGPAKARRWLRGHEGGDLWLWTEAIPYDVVRSYAREISVSAALYAAWLGEPPPPPHTTLPGAR